MVGLGISRREGLSGVQFVFPDTGVGCLEHAIVGGVQPTSLSSTSAGIRVFPTCCRAIAVPQITVQRNEGHDQLYHRVP